MRFLGFAPGRGRAFPRAAGDGYVARAMEMPRVACCSLMIFVQLAFCSLAGGLHEIGEVSLLSVSALRGQGLLGSATPLKMNLEVLRPAVASHFEIPEEKLQQRSRGGKISQARAVYCYCATRKLNYSGTLIGRFLKMGSSSVSRAAQRGEKLVQEDDGVRTWLENLLKQQNRNVPWF